MRRAPSCAPIYLTRISDHHGRQRSVAMSSRRSFLTQSMGAAVAAAGTSALAEEATKARAGGDLLSRMSWLNPPATEFYESGAVTARCKGKTDFWRKTFYGYVNDNGHFLHLPAQ